MRRTRSLILAAALGMMALPAFGAEDAVPAPTPEAVTPTSSTTQAESPTRDESTRAVDSEAVDEAPSLAPLSADAVARGTFTTAVESREPVDSITALGSNQERVFYFTELVGIGGREVTHRWDYQGEVVAEVPFAVGGPRWRAYSSKTLHKGQLGEWTVTVVDETGAVLRTDNLVYEAAAPQPESAEPTEATVSDDGVDEAPASPAPVQP
jgi:hypothetical protein